MLKHVTRLHYRRWIDGDVSFVDVLDDAFLIDQERGAVSKTLLLVEDTISLHYRAFEIAEYRECDSELFGEFAVGGNAVDTHAEDLRVVGFELGDISLIRLQFLRSTTGKRQYIDREYDVLLPFEIAQLVGLPIGGTQRKLRRLVTDSQVCFRWSWLLGQCDNTKHSKQQEGSE